MSERDNSGPAFPLQWHPEMGFSPRETPTGMTLRDWFAGQALVGISGRSVDGVDRIAFRWSAASYAIADAMLRERAK